jgi:DnaK suppressor protein
MADPDPFTAATGARAKRRTVLAQGLLSMIAMDARVRATLVQALRRRRAALAKLFADAEADLASIGEVRPAEAEECAQAERAARVLARVDDRALDELAAVDAALQRVIDGTYGTCVDCGRRIPAARLRAAPAAASCLECTEADESPRRTSPAADEPTHPGVLPPDLDTLLDRDVEASLRALVHDDPRLDTEELRLVCRGGVVHLEGAVPSEAEHAMLLHLLTDVAGCEEVVDRLQVNELLWERGDRSRAVPRERVRPARLEPVGTDDPTRTAEEGVDYVPPDLPPAEEEER